MMPSAAAASLALWSLVVAQLAALVVLAARLARGRHRFPAVEPREEPLADTTVSVVVPTRNEAHRVGRCLEGLMAQGAPLVEILVVDSRSTDGTDRVIDAAAARDPRIRRLGDDPLPSGFVGRPWALAYGFARAGGEWVLGVDADVEPRAGMVAGCVAAARAHALDVASFAPRLRAPSAGARWLQPALLATLVYRFGPAGAPGIAAERLLANGQCLLMRRETLEASGGYGVAARSYCDDVSIVRHLAAHGARVGFLDAPRLLDCEMYATAAESWRAWPPSLGMRDATTPRWRAADALFLALAQALPLPVLAALGTLAAIGGRPVAHARALAVLATVNALLLLLRLLLLAASAHSFERRGWPYWCSPLADLPAVARVISTMLARPREWRGVPRQAASVG